MMIYVNLELYAKHGIRAAQREDITAVIDVFRCSSTVVAALSNGAAGIIPVSTVRAARQLHEMKPYYLLAGERKGLKPEGFDLGNSPREYVEEVVEGKHIILTTTDGTKALQASRGRGPVLVGSFLNAEAVSRILYGAAQAEGRGITIVASGLKGEVSLEDTLCAGKIIEGLPEGGISFSDAAFTALLACKGAGDGIGEICQTSIHGKYLEAIGLGEDLRFCTRLNVSRIVPVMVGDELVPMSQAKPSHL